MSGWTDSRHILWNSKIAQSPPIVRYDSLLPTVVGEEVAEKGMLRWLDKVVSMTVSDADGQHEFGFCFVTGVPATPHDTQDLIERIARIRHTHCE